MRNGHDNEQGPVDHTDIYRRVDEVEQRVMSVLKWAIGIAVPALVAWALYSGNANSKQQDRDIAMIVQVSELGALVKSMQAQVLSLQSYVQDQNRILSESMEEHEHNPNAHHDVTGSPTYRYKTPYHSEEAPK